MESTPPGISLFIKVSLPNRIAVRILRGRAICPRAGDGVSACVGVGGVQILIHFQIGSPVKARHTSTPARKASSWNPNLKYDPEKNVRPF